MSDELLEQFCRMDEFLQVDCSPPAPHMFSLCSICGSPMAQDENGNWYCPNCDAEDIK